VFLQTANLISSNAGLDPSADVALITGAMQSSLQVPYFCRNRPCTSSRRRTTWKNRPCVSIRRRNKLAHSHINADSLDGTISCNTYTTDTVYTV